jgi:hypothetical protein
MPFDANNLRRIATMGHVGNDATRKDATKYLWSYVSDDAFATIEAANYIPATYLGLARGDVIMVTGVNSIGGTPRLKNFVVTVGRRTTGDAGNTLVLQATTAG